MDINIKKDYIELIPETPQDESYLKFTLGLEQIGDKAELIKSGKEVEQPFFGKQLQLEYKIKPKGE